MTILVIGANSKLAIALGEITDAIAVSHLNIPKKGSYSAIYILSYSLVMKENIYLMRAVSKLTSPTIVLISSVTTLIDSKYKFRYTTVKRHCEMLANNHNFKVVRIGLVLETLPIIPKSGTYVVTSLSDVKHMIANRLEFCPEPKILSLWGIKGQMLEKIYFYVLNSFGAYSFLIRPIDLALKFFGHSWYGYNSLIVDLYRKQKH